MRSWSRSIRRTTGEMQFKTTYFLNFRNLINQRCTWSEGFNLITGPNGAGKTNFLEGVNLISGWGPLERGTKIADLSRWNQADRTSLWARVSGEESADIFASIAGRSALKFADKSVGAGSMRSRMPVLSFFSDSVSLIKGGASVRRQLIDRIGALVNPAYAKRLSDYRKLVKQKSVLLRRRSDTSVVDRLAVGSGDWLWSVRDEIVEQLRRELAGCSRLLPKPVDLVLSRGGTADGSGDYRTALELMRPRERASATPLVGPQRDDMMVLSGGRQAGVFLSRGQCRRTASALVLASASVVMKNTGRKPVLVFDELTSELDAAGRDILLGTLTDSDYQIFAASADLFERDKITVHRMADGRFIDS